MFTQSSHAAPRYLLDLFTSGTPSALSDTELLDRFASRKTAHDEAAELAFAALLARHGPMVLRVCRAALAGRHEVEDAFQATFLVLAVRARSIRKRTSVAAWLHGVALRIAHSERSRAARRRRHELIKGAMTSSTTEEAGSDPVIHDEQALIIQVDDESTPAHILLGTPLFDATLRAALTARLGQKTLAATVSADAIALWEEAIASMARAKIMLTAASVVTGMLLFAGVGLVAYAASRQASPPRTEDSSKEARRPAAVSQPEQKTSAPAATAPHPDANQGPVVIQAEVVDQDGRRLPGADVLVNLRYSRGAEDQESVVEQTRTDGEGRIRLEVARERPGARLYSTYVWAHQPGRALATTAVFLGGNSPPAPIRLTLDRPASQTITIVGSDDRPIAGLRVTPISVRSTNRRSVPPTIPDEWVDRLTAITNAKGVATLEYLPATLAPQSIRVSGPEVAPHALLVDAPQGKDAVIKLARPGRLVGFVRTVAGEPLADVPVEVWAQGGGIVSGPILNRRATADEIVRLDPALKTGPQGAFQTPPNLLSDSSYRVSIRRPGFVPYFSEWVRLDGERATIPLIRLQPLQRLSGRVQDRQGHAVAGAHVFVPGGGPRSTTDANGTFALGGVSPGKTVVLFEHTGFWLDGLLIDPTAGAQVGPLTLVPKTEQPGPIIKPLADPISPEEARALADRLLEPYLRAGPQQRDDRARLAAIASLGEFDLARALDLLQDGEFPAEDPTYQFTRSRLAPILAVTDPASADAMAEAIPAPARKAQALADIAGALPAADRARKRDLLERVAFVLRNDLKRANVRARLRFLTALAEQWLGMGDRDRARPLLDEGKSIYDSLSPEAATLHDHFLAQLARLEPDQALERLRKLPLPTYSSGPSILYDPPAAVAVELAIDHPAEAVRAFQLWQRTGVQWQTNNHVMRLCRRLARVDPPRARRVAALQQGPAERAMAWAYVALGLAETKKPGASEAVDQAIQEIDRLRESGPGPDQIMILQDIKLMYPTNPAAAILPVVELSAPERLAEVFWRAVALHPRVEQDKKQELRFSYVGFECMLLARYDREVAAVLFQPMDAYLRLLAAEKGPHFEFNSRAILGKGCIDPRAAVALLESLTPSREFTRNNPVHDARLTLAEALGLPSEKRWRRLWRSMAAQIPLEE